MGMGGLDGIGHGIGLGFSLVGVIGDDGGQAVGQAILALQAALIAVVVILAALAVALFAIQCVRGAAPSFVERRDATMRQWMWTQLRADEELEELTAGRIGRMSVGKEIGR